MLKYSKIWNQNICVECSAPSSVKSERFPIILSSY